MFHALLLLISAGLCTALCGIVFSRVAKSGANGVFVLMVSSILASVTGFIIFPDYGGLADGFSMGTFWLVMIVFASGIFCSAGLLLVTMSMNGGHHGMAWTISQSCLIWPLVACNLFFHEPFGFSIALGLTMMIAGIACVGAGKNGRKQQSFTNRHWMMQAFLAFALFGIQQTLLTLPSRVEPLRDIFHLRIPVLQTACLLVYCSVWFARGSTQCKHSLKLGTILGVCVVVNFLLLFAGLDSLGKLGIAGIGYPIVIGSNIVFFCLYSIFAVKEETSRVQLLGTAMIIAGIILLSVPH